MDLNVDLQITNQGLMEVCPNNVVTSGELVFQYSYNGIDKYQYKSTVLIIFFQWQLGPVRHNGHSPQGGPGIYRNIHLVSTL